MKKLRFRRAARVDRQPVGKNTSRPLPGGHVLLACFLFREGDERTRLIKYIRGFDKLPWPSG